VSEDLWLDVGDTVTLTATATHSDGTSATVNATWGSSNSSVASVSAVGVVTAHALGTATITATSGGQSGSVSIEVASLLSLEVRYRIEIGSASGLSNLLVTNIPNAATNYNISGVGAGTHYVRVRAVTAAGTSGASNEVTFTR